MDGSTGERKRAYDLSDRLVAFAVLICRIVETLPSTRVGRHIGNQLLRSGTAPAPHHAEAQAGESRRDFIHKLRLCLKELRETEVWLRLAQRLTIGEERLVDRGVRESDELIRILVASIASAERNRQIRS